MPRMPAARSLVLDAVDLADDVEGFLRLGVKPLLEDLPTRVREAAGAHALARLGDRVVARVLVDDESPLRVAEHLLGDLATPARGVAVDDQLRRHEVPDEGALLEAELADAGLVGVHVERRRHERKRGGVQRAQLIRCAMEEVAHRAARYRDAELPIALLQAVLRDGVATLAVDQMGDEARGVACLLADSVRGWRGHQVTASTRKRLALVDAAPEVRLHVLEDHRGLAVAHAPHLAVAALRACARLLGHRDGRDLRLERGVAQGGLLAPLLRRSGRVRRAGFVGGGSLVPRRRSLCFSRNRRSTSARRAITCASLASWALA